jgi:NADP-dependent 3-hydroxy acid dehydrogenase YdfG
MVAYGAAKRGLEASFDSMRLELAHHGIAVGMIYPGDVETEVVQHSEVSGSVPPGLRTPPRSVEGTVALRATAVADAIVFMLSQPEGGAVNNLVLRPIGQLNP